MTVQFGRGDFTVEGQQQELSSPKEAKYNGKKITLGVICTLAFLATGTVLVYMAIMKGREGAFYSELGSKYFNVAHSAMRQAILFGLLAGLSYTAVDAEVGSLFKSQKTYKDRSEKLQHVVYTMVALAALAAAVYFATQLKPEALPR